MISNFEGGDFLTPLEQFLKTNAHYQLTNDSIEQLFKECRKELPDNQSAKVLKIIDEKNSLIQKAAWDNYKKGFWQGLLLCRDMFADHIMHMESVDEDEIPLL